MIKKNQIIQVEVTDVTSSGDGVAKKDGYPIFIKGAVTGDVLNITVTKTNKTYGFGRINEVVSPSKHRVAAPCPVFQKCGGCDFMHIDYEHQLEIKSNIVTENLKRIGGIQEDEYIFDGIIASEQALHYRNKSQLPIGKGRDGIILGFYERSSHQIAACNECLIQDDAINQAAEIFSRYANREHLTAYNEKSHTGLLRHLYIRTGNGTDEMLMTIVTNSKKPLPSVDSLAKELKKKVNIKGIVQNINTADTNLILGKENRLLWGNDTIVSMIDNMKFIISPESFFQVNGLQTYKLYSKALEYASLSGNETVFDLYCGTGSISLFLSQKAKKVIGVEIVEKAVENAKENARINNIENAFFYSGDCAEVVTGLISDGENADVVVLDPPRKGCSQELLSFLKDISPKKIVYVSCNSATLARDIKILRQFGFEPERACAVDMFPQTSHVECVVRLCRT